MGAAESYCRDISQQLLYLATWPPGSPVSVGRVGRFIASKVFDPETSLASYGIPFDTETQPTAQPSMHYTSDGVNDFGVTLGASIPDPITGIASLGAATTIEFANQHETLFFASGLRHVRMADQPRMARAVKSLMDRKEWHRDWYIVTEVIAAESASVLISNAGSASAELALSADAQGLGVNLLHADFKPRIVRQKAMHTAFINENASTPLFRAKRVKRSLFVDAKLSAGYTGTDTATLDDLNDEALASNLFDEVESVDGIVLGDA